MKLLRTYDLITQENMAKILGISRTTYKEYELQNSIIPIQHLNNFCNYFNISIDYLFDLTDKNSYINSKKNINKALLTKRLKKLRNEFSLSQIQMSKELNVDNSTISKYERGKNLIATPFLYQICKKYNISADYLLGKIDESKYLK